MNCQWVLHLRFMIHIFPTIESLISVFLNFLHQPFLPKSWGFSRGTEKYLSTLPPHMELGFLIFIFNFTHRLKAYIFSSFGTMNWGFSTSFLLLDWLSELFLLFKKWFVCHHLLWTNGFKTCPHCFDDLHNFCHGISDLMLFTVDYDLHLSSWIDDIRFFHYLDG